MQKMSTTQNITCIWPTCSGKRVYIDIHLVERTWMSTSDFLHYMQSNGCQVEESLHTARNRWMPYPSSVQCMQIEDMNWWKLCIPLRTNGYIWYAILEFMQNEHVDEEKPYTELRIIECDNRSSAFHAERGCNLKKFRVQQKKWMRFPFLCTAFRTMNVT